MKVSLIGIKGLPARYGGFETFAQNLVLGTKDSLEWTVYGEEMSTEFANENNFQAITIPIKANGWQSIIHDSACLIHSCVFIRSKTIVCLGYSGSWILPFIRLFSKSKLIVNIDGLEWRRSKFSKATRLLLYLLEQIALRYSDIIIIDNKALKKHVKKRYHGKLKVIEYGGDHIKTNAENNTNKLYKHEYYYSLSRIVPENNVKLILEAFKQSNLPLKYMGNWTSSKYGRTLYEEYCNCSNIELIQPDYDNRSVQYFRNSGKCYVHGHGVGGTNPSLVEALYCNNRILSFDCIYNRETLSNCGDYFSSIDELKKLLKETGSGYIENQNLSILQKKYTWNRILQLYVKIIKN